jgi:hypothetical protein
LLTYKGQIKTRISALHITPDSEITRQEAALYEKEMFAPVKKTARELGISINAKYKSTEDVDDEILKETREGGFDLLLLGGAKTVFSENPIGGKIKSILNENPCNVGVFIDKGFSYVKNVLILAAEEKDKVLLEFGKKFNKSSRTKITVLDVGNLEQAKPSFYNNIPETLRLNFNAFEVVKEKIPDPEFLKQFDLMLISLDYWKQLIKTKSFWIRESPSILIIQADKNYKFEKAAETIELETKP